MEARIVEGPALPALVGLGASAIAAGRHATDQHLELASRLLGAVGIVVTVGESALDAVTGDAPLFPQRLINVPIRRGFEWGASDAIQRAERDAVAVLDGSGRVLLRPSGTEPVVRVMVEAETEDLASNHASTIAEVVRASLG